MTVERFDCIQGTPEWHECRLGLPTASRFSDLLAKGEGKMRNNYLNELAADIYRGFVEMDSYSNAHMERGKEQESDARKLYAFERAAKPELVGFLRNGRKGASPDSLIGDDGGLEIKCCIGRIQIERLRRGDLPPEYRAQVQGNLWVSEREWWDFVSYSPALPLMVTRVYRDEAYIANLAKAVDAFVDELSALVDAIRTYDDLKGRLAA